jgi:methionyl-tRNA formyltransferase
MINSRHQHIGVMRVEEFSDFEEAIGSRLTIPCCEGIIHARITVMPPRLVFMGSPEFALPTLRLVAGHYPIVGVVTQPDRPAGRGKWLTPPPVKLLAQELGLPAIQPERLKAPDAMQQLRQWAPELIVVAAFGQILRQEMLELPKFGCVNVHASLLPRWRGSAPIQAAILAGDAWTGVTIMRMEAGVDTGPILSQRGMPVMPEYTAGFLSQELAALGAELLVETLPGYLGGELIPQSQNEASATYAPMLKKEDGLLDFSRPAAELARRVRAFNPWPGAFTLWQEQPLKVLRAHAAEDAAFEPGKHLVYERLPGIGTRQGILVLDEVQPAGKRPMPGGDFLHGTRDWGK